MYPVSVMIQYVVILQFAPAVFITQVKYDYYACVQNSFMPRLRSLCLHIIIISYHYCSKERIKITLSEIGLDYVGYIPLVSLIVLYCLLQLQA